MFKKTILGIIFFVLISAFSSFASAPFPTQPIELIVPYDPGGGMDLMARSIAPGMSEVLGQPVIVVNKPGGSGSVGTSLAAKRKPDGYTLLAVSPSPILYVPNLKKVDYNVLTDFTYIAGLMAQPKGVQVLADAPWKTFKDLLDDAKKNPGKIKYGTTGANSYGHLYMEDVAKRLGITWTHIPFNGDGTLMPALLGGHIMVSTASAGWVPHARAGRVRPLTFFTEKRVDDFPDIPTLNEFGFDYYLGDASLNGVGAPKGLPVQILRKLEEAIKVAAESPKFKEANKTVSHMTYFQNSEEFTKAVEKGYHIMGEMLKRIQAK